MPFIEAPTTFSHGLTIYAVAVERVFDKTYEKWEQA